MTTEVRLKKTYKSGSNGDTGMSYVLHNRPPILKSSPACKVQGEIEKVRHNIEELLYSCTLIQEDLTYVLTWLDRNLFSLASFCYMKGESSNHVLPTELLDFLDKKTAELKVEVGDCQDFLNQSHINLIKLDGIRIEVRQLESAYVAWWHTQEMISFLMDRDDLITGVKHHAAILNRLSAYLFEATRMEAKLMNTKDIYVEQRPWQANLESFNPPL